MLTEYKGQNRMEIGLRVCPNISFNKAIKAYVAETEIWRNKQY